MEPSRGLPVRFRAGFVPVQAEPAAVEGDGAVPCGGEVEGEGEAAEELRGGDAAGTGCAAGVDGETEGDGAAERCRVEVEAGGGGDGVGSGGGGGREREKRGLRGEVGGADFAEAWGGGRVDAGDWWGFGGGGKV